MRQERTESLRVSLARVGVQESEKAQNLLDQISVLSDGALSPALIINALALNSDPDSALFHFVRILEASEQDQRRRSTLVLAENPDALARLLTIIGLSFGFAEFLERHPDIDFLVNGESIDLPPTGVRERILESIGVDPSSTLPIAPNDSEETLNRLRVAYRWELLGIASRDLSGGYEMEVIAGWLSELADCVLIAALAIARAGVEEKNCPIAVIAMGKAGGRELNYVSDVDVIFATDNPESVTAATALARGLMRACSAVTSEGMIWEVDAALRPEGKQGALVRTVDSHVGYYDRWAKTWEFQALMKARFVAGDQFVGERYIKEITPFIWSAADRDGFVSDVQSMRRRVEEHVDPAIADRELKLGPGGLRDIEFSVQLLQLVHGRSDELIRSSNTIDALRSLAAWGYIGRDEAIKFEQSYRFLRTLEHHVQLRHLRRTHLLPEDPTELAVLATSIGITRDPESTLLAQWRSHTHEVRRIHEKLFYRPLLNAVAGLGANEARLSSEAAIDRLRALGYLDPQGALRHIEALSSGVSRRAIIQRTLLPVMLSWFAQAPFPDTGLLAFRQVSDQVGSSHWYLRLLRDESQAAERLAHILATSKYLTDLIRRGPESISLLAHDEDLTLPDLVSEVSAILKRHDEPPRAIASLRAMRRRELFRIGASDINNLASAQEVGRALSEVTDATLDGALSSLSGETNASPALSRIAIIAMGSYGGRELSFGSDADVMFVYEPLPDVDPSAAHRWAQNVVSELRSQLSSIADEPALQIDADLRPEGKNGPIIRSLDSYAAYYAKWSSPWEAQALIRARYAAGDQDLGARFTDLIDPLRYPKGGVSAPALIEMRRLKARMEAERLPRGADPTRHVKLGRGGLSDVEWTVQLLQMQFAHENSDLQVTSTIAALHAAAEIGLMTPRDRDTLEHAWSLASSVRNAIMLVRAKPSDLVPAELGELAAITYCLGLPTDRVGEFEDTYLRATRRARRVTERLFFGLE